MDLNILLGVAATAVVLIYLAKVLKGPLMELGRMALRTLVAFAGIWAFDVVGALFGVHIGLNVLSALTIGVLGLPGVALLFVLKYFLPS
jgi:inhibitor of the pro-sigma K processing machinery